MPRFNTLIEMRSEWFGCFDHKSSGWRRPQQRIERATGANLRSDRNNAATCDQNAPFVALYASSALSRANAWLTTGMG